MSLGAFLPPKERDLADRRERERYLGKKLTGSTDEEHLCWTNEEEATAMVSMECGTGVAEGAISWAWQKAGTLRGRKPIRPAA